MEYFEYMIQNINWLQNKYIICSNILTCSWLVVTGLKKTFVLMSKNKVCMPVISIKWCVLKARCLCFVTQSGSLVLLSSGWSWSAVMQVSLILHGPIGHIWFQNSEGCVLWLLSVLIMAHGGIVMQMVLCIIELKDCQSATQPKKCVIKHIDTLYKHTHPGDFMLVSEAEVCQSVQTAERQIQI